MSECKHGYYCKDGTPCVLCHEDELADLRASNARLREALEELIEVSDLRGDIDEIPHPCDDPKLWTARLISAWDNARAALEAKQ